MYAMQVSLSGHPDATLDRHLELVDKHALHRVEKALIKAMQSLEKLTDDELERGKKMSQTGERATLTFKVDITQGVEDFGGYTFRWPGQGVEGRAFLLGLVSGAIDGSHGPK